MADNIIEMIREKDAFANLTGVEIDSAGEGKAVGHLKINERHINGLGMVQGGAIFTLADTVFAAASNSRPGTAVAVNVSISYCLAAKEGTLVARAEEVSLNRKLATYLVKVTDQQENLIALFQGTVYRKN